MAASRRVLVLFIVLVAAIGAVLWLVLGTGPADVPDDRAQEQTTRESPPAAAATANAVKAPRGVRAGTAAVVGVIRRSREKAPVVAQKVELRPERGEPWVVSTDDQGGFRLDKIPQGGPYELRVAASGCGTIRLPGIALSRNEQRNVGTLILDPAVAVTVKVRSSADVPVGGATVSAFAVAQADDWDWSKAVAQMGQEPVAVASVSTDASGTAVFPEMAVGRWTFTAKKEGFAPGGRSSVQLRSDATAEPIQILLSAGWPLAGHVLDHERRPVADALVMAGGSGNAWDLGAAPLRHRTITAADGRYAFPDLESGDTTLWVARGTASPAPVAMLRVPLVAQYDVTLAASGTIAGAVTEQEGGKPVEGAVVRATCWGNGTPYSAEAATDAEGRYRLELAAGMVNQLTAEKDGFVQAESKQVKLGSPQFPVAEGAVIPRDLVLRHGAKVWGIVSTAEGPVPGAKVVLHSGSPNRGWTQTVATTDASGRYEFASSSPGKSLLQPMKEGLYAPDFPANWWDALQRADAAADFKVEVPDQGEVRKDLRIAKGATVEGRVEGPDGAPLAGVRVSGAGAESPAPTGADGAFRLVGVTPDPAVTLWLEKTGYTGAANKPIPVTADAPVTGIVLRMVREARIHGTVTVNGGGGLRDARVFVAAWQDQQPFSFGNDGWIWQNARRAAVKADGSYEVALTGSATGKFVVRAVSVDHQNAESKPIDVVEAQIDYEVNLTLSDGRALEGLVVAKGGAPIAAAQVSVTERRETSGMTFVMNLGGMGRTVWAVTDADGRFSVPHMAPGKYEVVANAPQYVESTVQVDFSNPSPVTVELSPELAIEGVAQYGDGRPVEGVQISAQRAENQMVYGMGMSGGPGGATTDASGKFRVTGLAEGTYTVTAQADWNSDVNVRQKTVPDVAAGARDLRIVLEEGGTISGKVLDSKHRPVPNVQINANPTPKQGQGWQNEWHNSMTREDGTFRLTALHEGPYNLQVAQNWGGGNSFRPVTKNEVPVGTKDLEFVLEEGLSISGTVVDGDGKALDQQVLIQAMRIDGDASQGNAENGQSWVQSGTFTLSGLAPGNYRLSLPPWGGPNAQVALEDPGPIAAGSKDVRLVVTKGVTITGIVVDETGAPIAGANVQAVRAGVREHNDDWRWTQCGQNGTFELAGLRAGGSYNLQCYVQDRVPAKAASVVAGSRDVRLVCTKGIEASGRVLDAQGAPMKKAQLQFAHQAGEATQSAQTDDQGHFTAKGLVAGTYNVAVLVGQEFKNCGTLRAGDSGVDLRIQP